MSSKKIYMIVGALVVGGALILFGFQNCSGISGAEDGALLTSTGSSGGGNNTGGGNNGGGGNGGGSVNQKTAQLFSINNDGERYQVNWGAEYDQESEPTSPFQYTLMRAFDPSLQGLGYCSLRWIAGYPHCLVKNASGASVPMVNAELVTKFDHNTTVNAADAGQIRIDVPDSAMGTPTLAESEYYKPSTYVDSGLSTCLTTAGLRPYTSETDKGVQRAKIQNCLAKRTCEVLATIYNGMELCVKGNYLDSCYAVKPGAFLTASCEKISDVYVVKLRGPMHDNTFTRYRSPRPAGTPSLEFAKYNGSAFESCSERLGFTLANGYMTLAGDYSQTPKLRCATRSIDDPKADFIMDWP